MAKPTATLAAMLTTYKGLAVYASLHTADPGTTGASEAVGGSYARQAVSWPGSVSGSPMSGGTVTFPVPAGTYTHVGFWSASTGGTYVDGYALNASVTFAAAGSLPVAISETQS